MFRQSLRLCLIYSSHLQSNKLLALEIQSFCKHPSRFINVWSNFSNCVRLKENSTNSLKDLLSQALGLSSQQCEDAIIENNYTRLSCNHANKVLQVCKEFQLDNEVILRNLKIMDLHPDVLRSRLHIINKMNLKDLSHGLPFVMTSNCNFNKLIQNRASGRFEDRLYCIADKLKRPPDLVAASITKRFFIYTMDFNQLKQALDILLEYGMPIDNIMKDWWVVRYKPAVIRERLETSLKTGRKKLMPWMVKCTEPVFQRSTFITKAQNILHRDKKSLEMYLADTLECSLKDVDLMCQTFPRLSHVRVCKVQQVQDFLLKQGFSKKDIIEAPKVFAHSIATISKRLEQLNNIGVDVKSLKCVCKSSKAFEKYLKLQQQNIKLNKLLQ